MYNTNRQYLPQGPWPTVLNIKTNITQYWYKASTNIDKTGSDFLLSSNCWVNVEVAFTQISNFQRVFSIEINLNVTFVPVFAKYEYLEQLMASTAEVSRFYIYHFTQK